MVPLDTKMVLLITVILLISVILDLKKKKIPNILTFGAMIIAIAYHSLVSGFEGFIFSAAGLFLGMALLIAFYVTGGMGAGDVKLMGAVGGFLGPKGVLAACLYSAIVGGVYALVVLKLRGYLKETFKRYALIIKILMTTGTFSYVPDPREDFRKIRLCYGIAIGLGTISSILLKNPF